MKASEHPVVEIPKQGEDRPVWAKAGIIALIGFVIGIAWPRLAGVRLGPTPPEENRPAAATSASASSARPLPSAAGSTAPVAASASAQAPANTTSVVVTAGRVVSCRNLKGKTQEQCDTPSFDAAVGPKLKALGRCPATAGLNGKMSIGFDLDFNRNRWKLVRGKSTTLPENAADAVWQCLESELKTLDLESVTHQHARYTIFYTAQLVPPGKTADIEPMAETEPAADTAAAKGADSAEPKAKEAPLGAGQVVYDAALVRDEPKEGKVIARLVRGTKVDLLSRKGSWYRIRFGEREGWVYSGSIGQ